MKKKKTKESVCVYICVRVYSYSNTHTHTQCTVCRVLRKEGTGEQKPRTSRLGFWLLDVVS